MIREVFDRRIQTFRVDIQEFDAFLRVITSKNAVNREFENKDAKGRDLEGINLAPSASARAGSVMPWSPQTPLTTRRIIK